MKIRGQEINLEVFKEDIEYFKSQDWTFKKWEPSPAIKDKGSGSVSKFHGQKYKKSEWDYLESGWSHDHCAICTQMLFESDSVQEHFGYVNEEEDWICYECFNKIVKEQFKENVFVLKHILRLKSGAVYFLISPMVETFTFEISNTTYFGAAQLEKNLDIPRKILKSGEQDFQTFSVALKDHSKVDLFEENQIYELTNRKEVCFL